MNNKILIIGAGPAGTVAAIYLVEKGYSCTLIDKSEFPRDKVCGDAISGTGLKFLESFGVLDKVKQKGFSCTKKELYPVGGNPCGCPIKVETETIVIPRKDLDNILLNRAISLGAKFQVKEATGSIRMRDNSCYDIEVKNPKTSEKDYIKAKYTIIAAGCQSDKLFTSLKRHNTAKPDQVAYRGYYKADWPINERQYFFLAEVNPGYLWIFPLGNNVFNIGCGGKILRVRKLRLKKCLDNFINETNKKYDCKGEWIQLPRGAFLRTNFTNLKALKKYSNIIPAGEAMGSTYPFSGGGIGKAMNSGIIAARSAINIIEKKSTKKTLAKEYIRSINKEIKPSYYMAFKICNYLLTKTPLEKFIYKKVFKNNKSSDLIVNIMSKRVSVKSICSIKNILRLLFNKQQVVVCRRRLAVSAHQPG